MIHLGSFQSSSFSFFLERNGVRRRKFSRWSSSFLSTSCSFSSLFSLLFQNLSPQFFISLFFPSHNFFVTLLQSLSFKNFLSFVSWEWTFFSSILLSISLSTISSCSSFWLAILVTFFNPFYSITPHPSEETLSFQSSFIHSFIVGEWKYDNHGVNFMLGGRKKGKTFLSFLSSLFIFLLYSLLCWDRKREEERKSREEEERKSREEEIVSYPQGKRWNRVDGELRARVLFTSFPPLIVNALPSSFPPYFSVTCSISSFSP